jgi:hypothetical protein
MTSALSAGILTLAKMRATLEHEEKTHRVLIDLGSLPECGNTDLRGRIAEAVAMHDPNGGGEFSLFKWKPETCPDIAFEQAPWLRERIAEAEGAVRKLRIWIDCDGKETLTALEPSEAANA